MLVILTGVEAIKKLELARAITFAMNSFDKYKIGDYTVDFTKPLFTITDADGKVVYDEETHSILHNADGTLNEDGKAIFDQANEFMTTVSEKIGQFFYKSVLGSFSYDYGLEPHVDFMDYYPEVMEKYQNRPFDTAVLVGTFSKAFIDQVIADLGADQVKVVSIIRSPSVSYLLNTITPAAIEYRPIDESPIGVKYATEDFFTAYLDAIKLDDLSYVSTLKFEDIAIAGKFKVGDTEVPMPPSFEMHNWLITKAEFEKKDEIHSQDLDAFNTKANSLKVSIQTDEDISQFPESLFTPLNYVPLSFNVIFQ